MFVGAHTASAAPGLQTVLYIIAGYICTVIGVIGGMSFHHSAYAQQNAAFYLPSTRTNGGYNVSQYFGLLFFVVFLPSGSLLLLAGNTQLRYYSTPRRSCIVWVKILALLATVLMYVVFVILCWVWWGQLASCFVLFCPFKAQTMDSPPEHQPSAWSSVTATAVIFVSILLALAHTTLLCILVMEQRAPQRGRSQLGFEMSDSLTDIGLTDVQTNTPLISGVSVTDKSPMNKIVRAQRKSKSRQLLKVSCFILFLLFCFVLTTIFPPAYSYFFLYGTDEEHHGAKGLAFYFNNTQPPEHSNATMHTAFIKLSNDVVLKVYPDSLAFYTFILCVIIFGVLVNLLTIGRLSCVSILYRSIYTPVSFKLQSVFTYLPQTVNIVVGWLFLFALWAAFDVVFIIYWANDHIYEFGFQYRNGFWESIARTTGQFTAATLGLLFYPVSRQSILITALGISWERCIALHRQLGYVFIVSLILHFSFWYKRYAELGIFPHDVLAVPMYYPHNAPISNYMMSKTPTADNWTIPCITVVAWVSVIVFGVLTFAYFRRNHFELFYYSHHFFIVVCIMVLYHGNSSWYWLISGGCMYLYDRIIRFIRSNRSCGLLHIRPHVLHAASVTELCIKADHLKGFRAGSYAFVNIPSVSTLQWHPFSISSSPTDKYITFHIRNMGTMSFTDRLNNLAVSSHTVDLAGLVVRLDGPYGDPPDVFGYDTVGLVCGGIGVTPCHSVLRMLYTAFVRGGATAVPKRILLIWTASHGDMFSILEPSLKEIAGGKGHANQPGSQIFLVSLYASQSWGPNGVPTGTEDIGPTFTCRSGRPSLEEELRRIQPDDPAGKCLVYCCGPPSLMTSCQGACAAFGYEYFHETFEL